MTAVVSTAGDGIMLHEAHTDDHGHAQATISTQHLTVTWISLDYPQRVALAGTLHDLAARLEELDGAPAPVRRPGDDW